MYNPLAILTRVAVNLVIPFAGAWAKRQEAIILRAGVAFLAHEADTAKPLGILHPGRVLLRSVEHMPQAGVRGASAALELPSRNEGFDLLSFVRMNGQCGIVVESWKDEV